MSKNLASLKEVLCGTGDKEPQTEAVAQLAQELYNTNLLISLIANLQKIDFEVGEKMPSSCTDFMSLKYWLLGAHIEWSGECVFACLIWTSMPKAKKNKNLCISAPSLSGCYCAGEEGCGAFVQQYCETSDWHPHAHGRIHFYTPTDPLHASQRVSSYFQCTETQCLVNWCSVWLLFVHLHALITDPPLEPHKQTNKSLAWNKKHLVFAF